MCLYVSSCVCVCVVYTVLCVHKCNKSHACTDTVCMHIQEVETQVSSFNPSFPHSLGRGSPTEPKIHFVLRLTCQNASAIVSVNAGVIAKHSHAWLFTWALQI